jgi:DNA-binding MarR family transcriptional regulator
MVTSLGVTGPQRLVVRIVGQFPGIRMSQLAGILRLHASTVTVMVSRLVERGLVERRLDPRDLRAITLWLTEKGAAVNQSRKGTIEGRLAKALPRIERAQLEAAEEVLGRLARRLGG